MKLLKRIDGSVITDSRPDYEVHVGQLPSGLYLVRLFSTVMGAFAADYDFTSVYHDVATAKAYELAERF